MNKKVTVVGAGNVGTTIAQRIAEKELADVILIDAVKGRPQGKALDLMEAAPIEKHDAFITGLNTYDAVYESDVVIIAAGITSKPGMGRDDHISTNATVVKDVVRNIASRSPDAILIIVSSPIDTMCQVAFSVSGFPKNRVIGMAGLLDSARFRSLIAMDLNVSVENTHALVLGGHSGTIIPLPRYSTVAGIPITELLPKERIDTLIQKTANSGAEIVSLLKIGSPYYAPAAAAVEMAESILKDKKKILSCAAYLEGEYGIHGLFIGVPVKLGASGIEEIIEIEISENEKIALMKSAQVINSINKVSKNVLSEDDSSQNAMNKRRLCI